MIETFRLIQYEEDWKCYEDASPSDFQIYKIKCYEVIYGQGDWNENVCFYTDKTLKLEKEKEYISLLKQNNNE